MNEIAPDSGGKRTLILLLGLALAYRLLFLLAMPRVLDSADAIHYVETAATLARGDFFGYDPKIPFFYPLLCALASFVVGDLEWACRSVSLFFSVMTVLPVYLIARDLHGGRAARNAGLLIALWPWLADYASRVSTEATAVFFWLLAAVLFARGMEGSTRALTGSIPCFWALALTRPEGQFILLATLPAVVLLRWKPSALDWRRYGAFALPSLIFFFVNGLYVRALTGATTANYRAGFILEEFDYQRFVQTGVETVSNVFPVMLGPVLLLFLGVGFFHPRTRSRVPRLEAYMLFLAAAQWGVSLFVLSPAPRYLMAPLIVLLMWSACGIDLASAVLARAWPRWPRLRHVPLIAACLFYVAHGAITVGSEHLGRRPREPREYKEAGRWMADHLAPGLIFTRKPQVGYYAGMPTTGPALDDTIEGAVERAKAAGASYLVVDERYTAEMVPALRPLLDGPPENLPLGQVKVFDNYPGARVVIYRLNPAAEGNP